MKLMNELYAYLKGLTLVACGLCLNASIVAADTTPVSLAADAGAEVAERAIARWRELIEADVEGAYGFLSPTNREILSLDDYQVEVNPGMWRDVRVDSVSCDDSICEVVLYVKYDLFDVHGLEFKKKESWINSAGNWWYVPKH